VLGKKIQGAGMGLGQVQHVDIVADAGAVGRGVVRAEDQDLGCPTSGRVHHQRDEVLHAAWILAIAGIERSTRSIEVAQRHRTQAVAGIKPAQHPLDQELALAVGVLGPQGRVLTHRQGLGRAVHRGG